MPGLLFQPTTSLADMGNMGQVPPQFTLDALQGLRQRQSADTQTLADLPSAIEHEQAMRPLLEQREQAMTGQTQAQTGLINAQARMEGMKADEMQQTQQARIQDMISKYGHDKMARYAEEMQQLGPLMQQAGTLAAMGPGGPARAKKILTDSGHGDMWSETYDQLSPPALAQVLMGQGKQINETLPMYQRAIDQATLKAEYAARLEAFKTESRERIATQRTETARAMKQWELENQRLLDKPTYQNLSARYAELARQALEDGNQEQAAKFDAEAKRMNAAAMALPAVAANAANQGKVDPSALTNGAIPTLNPGRTNTGEQTVPGVGLPDRGTAPKAQPRNAQEAQAAGWKLHVDKNGNKAFVSPDGKSYIEAQ